MKTTINVLFKSMQKDDKKEILKFEIKGSEDGAAEAALFDLSGSIVVISMEAGGNHVVENVPAEFISMQRDSKKTVMKFGIKGDSEEKARILYEFAGRNVELGVQASQISIDEFRDTHEGIQYNVRQDGTVERENDPNQMTIDEAAAAAEAPGSEQSGEQPADDKVTDIGTAKKNRSKKKDDVEPSPAPPAADSDDELPF